jgi:uncharacterized protein YggE
MNITLAVTRRTAAVGAATVLALGAAFAFGLSGSSSPKASATFTDSVLPAADSSAAPADAFPGITVEGVGKVTGTPDTLILNISAQKDAGDVSTAMNGLSATMKAVQDSLTAHNVAAADMKTSNLDVNPTYDYPNGKQTPTGYSASEGLTVELRDTKTAGATISAATDAGGNAVRINGLSADLQNDSALLNSARDAAFSDAKVKAAQYAKDAGRPLGAVVRVQEATSSNPSPIPYRDLKVPSASGASSPVPVQVGSTDLTVTVTVVFALG